MSVPFRPSCRNAEKTTSATRMCGTIIGESRKPLTAPRHREPSRVRPKAAVVPSTVANSAVKIPTWRELRIAAVHSGDVNSSWYQRNDQPSGGNRRVCADEKLIGMTTSGGATRMIATIVVCTRSHRPTADDRSPPVRVRAGWPPATTAATFCPARRRLRPRTTSVTTSRNMPIAPAPPKSSSSLVRTLITWAIIAFRVDPSRAGVT
jgi:hypothetical protein